jgi:hypothetical protein
MVERNYGVKKHYLPAKRSIFLHGTPGNTLEHADYQQHLVLAVYNILIVSVLIGGLQAELTVYPGTMVIC